MRQSTTLGWLHHSSLLWRFLLIGIIALAPLVAALVQFAGDERAMALKATRERAELLASYAVETQHQAVEEARAVLRFLADAPEVRSGGPGCDAFLARHISLHRWMNRLRLSNLDGSEACSDRPDLNASSVANREFFIRARQGANFVLGKLVMDPETNSLSMTAAVPIIQDGHVLGVLSAGLNPGIFADRSPIDAGLDISMFVVD